MNQPSPDIAVMSFDQSPLHTGWAIGWPRDNSPLFGEFSLPTWGHEQEARQEAVFDFCMEMFARFSVTHVTTEEPVPAAGMGTAQHFIPKRGKNAGTLQARVVNQKDPDIEANQTLVRGAIWLAARKSKISVTQQSINDVRTFFNGRSRVAGLTGEIHTSELKQDSLNRCTRLGYVVGKNDNIAEAIAHLHYRLHSLDKHHQSWLQQQFGLVSMRMWDGKPERRPERTEPAETAVTSRVVPAEGAADVVSAAAAQSEPVVATLTAGSDDLEIPAFLRRAG